MDKYGVCDGDLALVCRNRSKIDLCGPKSVHDHGDTSYFVVEDFTDLYHNCHMDCDYHHTLAVVPSLVVARLQSGD